MEHHISQTQFKIFADAMSTARLPQRRKLAIKSAREAIEAPFNFYVLRMDGAIERYYGTTATKQGYVKETWYPSYESSKLNTYKIIN